MPFESLVLLIVAFVNLVFVGSILRRDYRKLSNLLFVLSIACNVLWAAGDALLVGLEDSGQALAWSRLFFVAPMFTVYFLILFVLSFPDNRRSTLAPWLLLLPTVGLAYLIVSDPGLLINDMVRSDNTNEFIVNKLPFLVYTAYFSLYFGACYLVLYMKSRRSRVYTKLERIHLKVILVSALLSSGLALFTNLTLPLMGNSRLIWLGPLFTLSYVVVVTMAILRYRLFDIKLAVARGSAYAMTLATLLVLYGLMVYVVGGLLAFGEGLTTAQKVVYPALALILGLLFAAVKKFFDKLTSKVFFRDNYNPQQFIDDLTGKIARIAGLRPLLDASMDSISAALKPERMAFVVRLSDVPGDVYMHTSEKNIPDRAEIAEMAEALAGVSDPIIMVDSSESLPPAMRRRLVHYGAAVLVRLASGTTRVGYLVLGEKKSGDAYNQQDIGVLDIISDELALAIENALRFDQIEKFNETLQEEVEDATRRLRYTNAKLRSLDETKDEFISMASHQLRTPLTSIKGYLSMVIDGDVGELNEQQRKMLAQAYSSSQRMNYLITDLLNVSRLRTGKFVIDKSPVNLADMVADEIGQLGELARAKNIEISYRKPQDFPLLELDDTKTRQVVMNFIDNALHYTPDGGKVSVELEARPRSVELRVIDNGMGVPRHERHKLFGKFFRADNARQARPDGNGLGLFMAKKVVIAQGGAIIFKSTEGKGSTFGFTFPRR